MNILLISQCHKNALKETRRIIDQFAERTGERSWQTHITEKGLEALRTLLKKTARKNTAVACHWIHRKNHSELLWIVGDKSQFNERGIVPTNRTKRNILKSSDECSQLSAYDIQIVAVLAGLLHDLGKSSCYFQNKLKNNKKIADRYRHEWLSLRLFQAMIKDCENDRKWLDRLIDWENYRNKNQKWYEIEEEKAQNFRENSCNFSSFPPLARIVAWLIASHHRMPIIDKKDRDIFQKEKNFKTIDEWYKNLVPTDRWVYNSKGIEVKDYYKISFDPTTSTIWQKELKRWANKALKRIEERRFFGINKENGDLSNLLQDPLFLHLARLCLVVGDHYFSAQKYQEKNQKKYELKLWANTDKNRPKNAKQLLDEHLCGVAQIAKQFARAFLWAEEPFAYLGKCRSLEKTTKEENFKWQNQAFDMARSLGEISKETGFFGVNSASTGCGKTLANARIMYGLSEENKARFTIALGLRTLTLQTGDALKKELKLTDDEIATLIGSSAIMRLHKLTEKDDKEDERNLENLADYGSESAENFLEEGFEKIRYESAWSEELSRYLLSDSKIKTLLDTPIISCTIDQLMQLCEQQKGGRFAPAMLRIFSSDIILDEPDDFSNDDLPALSRLVYWVGLLGGRILLSSATLTPDFCEGLFRAYREGRSIYNRHLGLDDSKGVCCAWFNEFAIKPAELCNNREEYRKHHNEFCDFQVKKLAEKPTLRKAEIIALEKGDSLYIAEKIIPEIMELHKNNYIEFEGKKISFGLVRFANIDPLIEVALNLLQYKEPLPDTNLHIICYHARQLLMLRSKLEKTLDRLLNRKKERDLFKEPEILEAIKKDGRNHIFIVLGSPITEVGRDHDYDWAIVEPSSLRSLIQLAGRVRRHRNDKEVKLPNIKVFNKNIKNLRGMGKKNEPFYLRPGFEKKGFYLLANEQKSKENPQLFDDDFLAKIDARRRIISRGKFSLNLVAPNLENLEHLVMAHLLNNTNNFITAYRNSENVLKLSADSQIYTPFRYNNLVDISYTALPNSDSIIWRRSEIVAQNLEANDNGLFNFSINKSENKHISRCLDYDYFDVLKELAAKLNDCEIEELSEEQIFKTAIKYCKVELNFYNSEQKWDFDPWLGFKKIYN